MHYKSQFCYKLTSPLMTNQNPNIEQTLEQPLGEPPTPSSSRSTKGIKRLLKQSIIQPDVEHLTKCQKIMMAIDIFSFIPVPQTRPVSTKRSKCGSITLIVIFLAYVIYDLVMLITNNAPKLNSYDLPLANTPYQVPQMAIGYIYGPELNMTLADPSYMMINTLEINTTEGKGTQTPISMYQCGNLPWMGGLQSFYQNLSCLNTSAVSLQGILYASPLSLYPRFVVTACNPNTSTVTCNSSYNLSNMTAGGRIFLFIQKQQSVNFAATKGSNSHTAGDDVYGTFSFYNFFLVPGLYNRITIAFQPTTYKVYPDYITSFTTKIIDDMPIVGMQFQTSNVTINNPYDMLSISILLSSQQRMNQIVYSTLIEHVSLWGAFWGVLFSIFAFYFLMFNRKLFYTGRPEWNRFEDKVKEIEDELRREYESKYLVEEDEKEMELISKRGIDGRELDNKRDSRAADWRDNKLE